MLVVVGLVALPAIALRAVCVGKSCEQAEQQPAPAPFCSLDAGTRALVTAGFYAGRSPDAIAVTSARGAVVTFAEPGLAVPWPSAGDAATTTQVPLALFGRAVRSTAWPSEPVGLDQVAPTLADLMGIRLRHPNVRSGQPIEGVTGAAVPLVVEIVWKGVGMPELSARGEGDTPYLSGLLDHPDIRDGVVGIATPGSLPLDPAAVLTTIGTGGLPSEHGVTGTVFMSDDGPVRAFSNRAPKPVIAALGDDLDHDSSGAAKIALVGDAPTDRGLIGGTWYLLGKRDDATVKVGGDAVPEVERMLHRGWGADAVPDLVGVTLRGSLRSMDDATRAIVGEVQRAVPRSVIAITSTGSLREHGAVDADADLVPSIDAAIPAPGSVVAAAGSEGLFLDRGTTTAAGITTQSVVDVMKTQTAPDGSALFADAFPSFAVQFGRYCS